ncbi:MAG: efflux RND transporter periplasmic adaptor subunit [Kiritimatiellia bacterium]|jgi:hypothetical protein|nr:efflux RND transporter periplasmic adaptor subunit [Kiritimatiellia bacterium]MDP6631152.1 efflux RND transporter periplasmic adaptor subunit [Kiritimatiellia bacterium]MDP6809826.1 efflux RND transporter periplasmic adaptor subunit [Kiritimatiellia bacterium]MDP7025064.1 efflux RND transporter periplasmic adaptor subunit [Kiritimatiellia bacterium]
MGKQAVGFDSARYLEEQSEYILERAKSSGDRLYLEFGGKLVADHHAARVLPGFDPHAKIRLLQRLKDVTDIILCIYAGDIERKKLRADFGITYDVDVLRLLDEFAAWGLHVAAVVITRYEEQPAAVQFKNRLERRGIRIYTHRATKGYPTDVDTIASEEGYGANPYIEVDRPVVVVTAPGPGSGKMATCLSQVYHDHQNGRQSGYAKFETFPIWNLPLKHPVNIAYEAATADLGDVNMVDPFHLEATGERAINYNRDIEIFPVLKRILEKVTGAESPYQSPTQMGVKKGNYVTPGAAELARIVQLDPIRVVFSQTDREYLAQRRRELAGDAGALEARVILPDGSLVATVGKKDFDDNAINPATGTIAVRYLFDNPDRILMPGGYVTARLSNPAGETGIKIPQRALLVDQDGTYVLTVDEAGTVGMARVETGARIGRDVVILSGLELGNLVITDGVQKAMPGATVMVVSTEG